MRKSAIILLCASLMATENEMLDLMKDLDMASEIATRTKLNIDKTPAIVSVLHGDYLKRLGINNLFEALETVPGIETSMGTAGAKQINMRGNKSIVRDKLKLMINGISVNTEVTGASFFYLDMPIELIERIEVVRGPSSALYGSFAHIGAINVITKNVGNSDGLVFANASSKGFIGTGFIQNVKTDTLKVGLDGFYSKNDRTRLFGPYDGISSQTEFKSYEDFTNVALGAHLHFDNDVSLQARWVELDLTNHFGYGDWPISHDPKSLESTSMITEIRYNPTIGRDTSLDFKAGYKQYIIDGAARMTPYSLENGTFDQLARGFIKEGSVYMDMAVKKEVNDHDILGGVYLAQSRVLDTWYFVNNPFASEVTDQPYPILPGDIKRKQCAVYLHDIYTVSPDWTINVGARYDHYDDADAGLAPKLALLYAPNDHDSYKFMYQRSFRAPTFMELYGTVAPLKGNRSLKTETIDTFELGYTHSTSLQERFTANVFFSNMQDFIETDSSGTYSNGATIESFGWELEGIYPLSVSTSIQANYSYIHAEEKDGTDLPFFANHLANVMLSKKWTTHWHTGSLLRYVGDRKREAGDPRGDLSGYTRFDQTLTYKRNAFTFQASVKNLFNDGIYYPSRLGEEYPHAGINTYTPVVDPAPTGTYMNDFPRDGRVFYISLKWSLQ